jgi:hypothetical protein
MQISVLLVVVGIILALLVNWPIGVACFAVGLVLLLLGR